VDPDRCLVSFQRDFCKTRWIRSGGARRPFKMCSASGSCYSSTISQASAMRTRPRLWDCPLGRCNAGGDAGPLAISASGIILGAARSRLFPPADHAVVTAMACEAVAETELPISRQSVADLTSRARKALGKPISSSTVWRMLHEDAIKPWQYEHWIFPRDPLFAEKAGRVLDLYAGHWEGKSLGPKDYVLSSDEKTSIQARQRRHPEQPPGRRRTRRIETEYKRKGALQYLATWDVHRGIVMGRCERRTGIRPFGRMVTQILNQEPYCDAERLFLIVDNGSSHRGKRSVERLHRRDKRIILVHTPVHASWLNQVEIYSSIIQRKVLTPNDFANLKAIRLRLALYEELTNRQPKPFAWKFTRQDLMDWLKRASPHFLAASAA
jgi:hypothetical protein